MNQPFAAPAGYIWTGTVFARLNPIPGDPENVLTVSQAAYDWNQPDPAQYLPPSTIPPATQTPVYGMDAQGNIGPITDPRYAFSVDQAQAAAAMAAQQLLASGSNQYQPPPTVTDSTGQTYVYNGPSNMPAPAPAPVVQTMTPPAYQPPTAQVIFETCVVGDDTCFPCLRRSVDACKLSRQRRGRCRLQKLLQVSHPAYSVDNLTTQSGNLVRGDIHSSF
jgi:hypothetical protein